MSGSRATTELQEGSVPERSTLWEKVKKIVNDGPKAIKGDKGSTVDTIKERNAKTKKVLDSAGD